jgi:hypothetical protein
MSLPASSDIPSRPTWSPQLAAAPEPTVAVPTVVDPLRGQRTELDDVPDLRTGRAVIDRWVDELVAADALDEATTDVFERLIDDWADRFRQRLLQDSLDQESQAELLQAEARGAEARARLDRKRAEREYAYAVDALEAARRAGRTELVAPQSPPDGPEQIVGDVPAATPQPTDWPEEGAA